MAVIIKDMEMPKNNCKECSAYVCYRQWSGDPGDEFCGLTKNNVPSAGIPYWCPLDNDYPLPDIVHCKDCINFLNNHICLHWSRYGTIETKPDDYCSYGEKL